MVTVSDVIAALEKFELDLVDKQWSDDIWSNDFTSCPDELPDEFGDKFSPLSYCHIVQVIEEADKIINMWLTEGSANSNPPLSTSAIQSDSESTNSCSSSAIGVSWTSLQDFDYKKLLAVLYFYICKGQINNQDINSVHTCVKATNFYYTLLMIPGSNVYKVFNMTLFEKCLETFSLHKYLEIATGRKIKKTKPKKNGGFSSDEEFLDIDETLTLSQQENVLKQLNFLLSTFQQLVNKFNFKKYPEAVNLSLSHLAELTRIERNSTVQEFCANTNNNSFAPLSRNAYLTMKDFCNSRHGRVPENVRLVLYYIMPNLTSIGGSAVPELNKFSQKELNNIRNVAVSFITDNIIPLGDAASLGLKILIQQICFNMLDRADYRSKATDMILTILSKLSMNLYYTLVMWIFRLSMMEGAHHRVIGLELLSKLLYMKPGTTELSTMASQIHQSQFGTSTGDQNGGLQEQISTHQRSNTIEKSGFSGSISQAGIVSFSHPINHVPIEYRRVMLAIVIDRIRDEAAIVRTRALSVIGELLSNKTSPTVKRLLEEIFIDPYVNMSVINTENQNDNGFMKWKTFVAAVDKVREKEINRKMIPSGKAIVNKIFEKCLDDRVNVRKAALQVIMKIFKFSSKWMTDKNLELYGRHCRDPALSIRKEMVSCVTELMLFFPDHERLTKLWVKEVVPQITDREIRVQEQVLQVFTSVILSKIVTFEKTKTATDELPWKLIDCIAQQKMRSFFVTACSLWKKSGQLSQNLVKAIKTHIGTVNDSPAWVLMSCISEYMDIDSPQFVMSHYLNYVSKNIGDVAVLNLSLITLNNSWHKLDKASLETLEKEMYSNMQSYSVPATLMRFTMEIATGITVRLAESDLAGKQEVAKWAADMIEKAEDHLQVCLKSKEATPCERCVIVLSLLGNLSAIRPDKTNNTTFVMLHDFLMNPKNERDPYYQKLRAMTIITISKMALRNDYFARNLVSSLSELLSKSSDPVILNNVIVAIADIGERYASLIEPLISSMCVCLKSKQKAVKKIALILLVELLQEDYLKARGALVFHLLTLINDSDPIAINIVKYYFKNCLIARQPYKMYELLLPSLFHFNQYTRHPDYPAVEMAESERTAFDLRGEQNHRKRMNIYKFMLSTIPDMVRMKCLHFICTVVLNGAADNIISIKSSSGEQLVLDALSVLLTKEIRIEYNELVQKSNEDGEEDDEQKQNPLYKLGKQVFSAARKKEIIETIIPICCKLKKKLHQENSKLLPHLHKFVREIVKDYKDEIGEMFKEDKQFGIEIMHELENVANNEEVEEAEEEEEEEEEAPVNDDAIQVHISVELEEHKQVMDADEPEQKVQWTVQQVEKFNPQELGLKEAVVCLERLSDKECGLEEEQHQDEAKKAAEDVANQEEALKRLSITLERLSSKYLKFLETEKDTPSKRRLPAVEADPKLTKARLTLERLDPDTLKEFGAISPGKQRFEDVEEAVKKNAAKVVMPPPNKKKGKGTASKKGTPNTPEQKLTKKCLVTSTPVVPVDAHSFSDISPVVDSGGDEDA